MMAPRIRTSGLIERLPRVRGRLTAQAPLAKLNWFRVGGPAEVLFRPADADDLAGFLAATPLDLPITILGVGSNVLVRDGGIPGVVIRLGRGFAAIAVTGTEVGAGAAAANLHVALAARDSAVAGFEFLCGVPGSIGGSLRMNAGAYGAEMADIVVGARAIDRAGAFRDLALADFGFGYRRSAIAADWIFIDARLRGWSGKTAEIGRRMAAIQAERAVSQPVRTPTGGSTFVNPPGMKAWELIARAGCRGLRRGGAVVSEKHCNFLINTGDATAGDLEGLGEEIRRRVFATTGVTLEWEIHRLGVAAGSALAVVPGEDGRA